MPGTDLTIILIILVIGEAFLIRLNEKLEKRIIFLEMNNRSFHRRLEKLEKKEEEKN